MVYPIAKMLYASKRTGAIRRACIPTKQRLAAYQTRGKALLNFCLIL